MSVNESMLTYTGGYANLVDPFAIEFRISDIAHALSQMCRFGGHTRPYYSVAQHSLLVSQSVAIPFRLQALLHDAAEAYCGDVVAPLKCLPFMDGYRAYEKAMQARLFAAFGVETTAESDAAVKYADLQVQATERRDLMAPETTPWPWLSGIAPRQASISPQMPAAAETQFLKRFKELAGVL